MNRTWYRFAGFIVTAAAIIILAAGQSGADTHPNAASMAPKLSRNGSSFSFNVTADTELDSIPFYNYYRQVCITTYANACSIQFVGFDMDTVGVVYGDLPGLAYGGRRGKPYYDETIMLLPANSCRCSIPLRVPNWTGIMIKTASGTAQLFVEVAD